jgi:hypothetical protein
MGSSSSSTSQLATIGSKWQLLLQPCKSDVLAAAGYQMAAAAR